MKYAGYSPMSSTLARPVSYTKQRDQAVLPIVLGTFICLIHLLLLIDGELAGAAVDKEEKTTDDGEDLEEIVLGEVLVGVEFG